MPQDISRDRLNSIVYARWVVPAEVLEELSRSREFLRHLNTNVGVQQSFSLRIHTLRVMDCFEKHFAQSPLLDARHRGLFRLFLALHDIGKPLAIEAGDKRWQHRFTVDLLKRTRDRYPVTDDEFADWIALVDGDPLGAYLKGETGAAEAGVQIRRMASRSSLPFAVFCRRLMTYYQCDVSGYTRRAGLMGALDGLFEWDESDEIRFDPVSQLLVFAPRVQVLLAGLSSDDFAIERTI
jgi:hypothetical protein